MPRSFANFNDRVNNLCQLTEQRTNGDPAEWDHIPAAAVAKLLTTRDAWRIAYAATLVAHSPIDTEAKYRVRGVMEAEVRLFINEYIRNSSKVTPEDRLIIGLHERAKPRRIEPPNTVPALEPHAGNPRQIEVIYRDANSGSRGKPKDVHGIEVRWAILDHDPTSADELIHSTFDTRRRLILEFGESDRGKRVYMAGRWEIERQGGKGPLGEIVSTFIP
jgi:hypothetical protein